MCIMHRIMNPLRHLLRRKPDLRILLVESFNRRPNYTRETDHPDYNRKNFVRAVEKRKSERME